MASNTYTAIYTTTLTGAASSINIPSITQSYTHLELVVNYGLSADADSRFTVNGDSTSGLYSYVNMRGNGSTANSGKASSLNYFQFGLGGVTVPTTLTSVAKYTFVDYSSTTKPKMILGRVGDAGAQTLATAGVWRNNNAITSITLTPVGANFLTGTTVSLYGILAEGVSPAPKATGGAIYSDSTYYYHVFGASGTFTPSTTLSCDILSVAGGGGGGTSYGGGGGAGGLLTFTSQSVSTAQTVTVGAGGAQGAIPGHGSNGTNSSFGALTASVGGGGGGADAGGANGNSGGSGGGGGGSSGGSGGAGTSGQGNAGGTTATTTAAGGGGAGAAGNTAGAGIGGVGLTSSFINAIGAATGAGQKVGTDYYFAGGGGSNTHAGGYGGGGSPLTDNAPGAANTGGGGGGWGGGSYPNWGGGSGVVIVRYAKA